jgi:hypothetical protein
MESREAYKQKYEAQLKEWGAKIAALKANAEKAQAQAKIDFAAHLNALHKASEGAKAKLEDVVHATGDKWQELKVDADKAWHEVEQALEGALAAAKTTVTSHTKKKE